MKSKILDLVHVIESLQNRRYPSLLIISEGNKSVTDNSWKSLAEMCSVKYVNYRDDILASSNNEIILGSYLRAQFIDWLKEIAQENGGVLIINADGLIASWNDSDRMAFFKEFLHIESSSKKDKTIRFPIILISRLPADYELSSVQYGQGVILNLSELIMMEQE